MQRLNKQQIETATDEQLDRRKYWCCLFCGKLFPAPPSRPRKYCSHECFYLSSRKKDAVFCFGKRFIKKRSRYKNYYISSDGKNLCLHKMIWEKVNGPVPRGFVIHHINDNTLDNRIENLALKGRGEHTGEHHLGKKKPRKTPPSHCVADGCDRLSRARNLCTMHYQRLMRDIRGYWM